MRTMHPVLMTGVNEWNEDWLPRDEYFGRLSALRQIMKARGWDGVIIHGDCDRCPIITYLTNYYPISRWSLVYVGLEGEPRLLVAGGTRDIPAAVDQSNLREMSSYGNSDTLLPEWVKAPPGRNRALLGSYGFGTMRPPIYKNITGILEPIADLEEADALLDAALFQRKRSREVEVIGQASGIVQRSLDAFAAAFRSGSTVTEAAIAAERTARLAAVQDVRLLVSFDGGSTLQPFFQMKPVRHDPVVVYLALRYCGYWSEAMTTLSSKPHAALTIANAELDAMIDGLKPDLSGVALTQLGERARGRAALSRYKTMKDRIAAVLHHPIVKDRIGYGIGVALEEAQIMRGDAGPVIHDGGVYTLHAGVSNNDGAALTSAIVHVTASGNRVLCRDTNAGSGKA